MTSNVVTNYDKLPGWRRTVTGSTTPGRGPSGLFGTARFVGCGTRTGVEVFCSADLNAAGWLTVLAPGIAIGTATAIAMGWPVALLAPLGALATWAVALGFDTRTHRRMGVSVHAAGMTREQLQPVVDRLVSRGIHATETETTETETDHVQTSFSIDSTMRHLGAIHAELERAREDRGD